MNLAWIRAHCLALPGVTEQIQWGSTLLFKVAGKMFVAMDADGADAGLTFKVTAEEFAELVERPGVIPAPYLARANWVALEYGDALPRVELRERITRSYELVVEKLPKATRAKLQASASSAARARARSKASLP